MTLTPSDRIKLIKEVSARLTMEEWPLIDLTLKQFGLPWSNQWNGTKDSYIIEMVENASDETLIELGQHVGFQFEEAGRLRVEPPFWREGMFKLFISHLAAHRAFAAQLQEALLNYGISSFVAHNDIEPTLEWQTQIQTALATSDALVALLHKDFHASNWTDQEIGFAMGRAIPVFSVRYEQDPYGFIGRFQAFNGNGKTATALARELFDAYRKNKQTQKRISEIVVGLFEESGSFAEARELMGYLEDLEVWEPSFSVRIRSAVKSNSQVSDSLGVPDRVEKLVKKWAASGV